MAHEKQFTPKQAALAVLEKVGEVLAKSELTKHEHVGWGKLHGKLEREGYSKDSADKIAGAIKAKVHPGMKKAAVEDAQIESKEESKIFEKAEGYKPENSKKENAKPSEHDSKDAMQHANGPGPKGEIHPKEKEEGAPTNKVREQSDPQHNPKEEAEGNNELAGTTPTQVGQNGKAIPGGDEIKGHLKLAKFIGRMGYKRELNKARMPG